MSKLIKLMMYYMNGLHNAVIKSLFLEPEETDFVLRADKKCLHFRALA